MVGSFDRTTLSEICRFFSAVSNWLLEQPCASIISRLWPGEQPPSTQNKPHFFFQQLSKLHSLNGRVAFDDYLAEEDRSSRTAQQNLNRAAEAYVLALGYAQLFSPRSPAITAVYDTLYDTLKQLDATQLTNFYRYEQEQRTRYNLEALKVHLENLGSLQDFLLDCFGDYYADI